MSTLWSKGVDANKLVEDFTVGNDRLFDLRLAACDIKGSMAHIKMLASVGLLENEEEVILSEALNKLLNEVAAGDFTLEDDVEDIHSQVELILTRRLGDIGKKIHSGRSRNDQVLTDIKLYLRDETEQLRNEIYSLFQILQELSEKHRDTLLPGYTHGQIAMPSSFGLWFGAYAETLADDMIALLAAWLTVNQNPLGSAAGYGSSFPLDRDMTTRLLNFREMNYNSVAAQMSRGKAEKAVAVALASVASTINKLSADCCMYMTPNFGFISFPDELTTGSSIMPHKKNPDVWELLRASANRIESIPNEISLLLTNLPHGYHRDFQLLKEILFPAIDKMHKMLEMTHFMLSNINVNQNILESDLYDYLFTVEEVNRRVLAGKPFRDAYKEVGIEVKNGVFKADKNVSHTHKGSIGNLATSDIRTKMENLLKMFSC